MTLRHAFSYFVALVIMSCAKDDPPPNDAPPDDTPVEIAAKVLVENLNFPWEILWGPDNMIWMTEKSGKISRVDPESGAVSPLATIDEVLSSGEGGLLGMVVFPSNTSPLYVFLAYDYKKGDAYTGKIVRYDYKNGTITNPLVLLDGIQAAGIHNGCRLAISKDEHLYITTGDASHQENPQNFSSPNGKILRINFDGSIPADNPDPTSPVWSWGHRNPQGLVFIGDSLFSSEHGPETDDEVNIIHRGSNYGWPHVRGKCDESTEQDFCSEHNVVEPILNWTPTIAVCGIDYYNQEMIPQWKNSILMCTLKNSRLMQLKLSDDQLSVISSEEFFTNTYGRLRDICIAPDGRVFICTSNGNNADVLVSVAKK
jgi:glucose/arabinose dehydrogenase